MTAEEFAALEKGDRIALLADPLVVWEVTGRRSYGLAIKPTNVPPVLAMGTLRRHGKACNPRAWSKVVYAGNGSVFVQASKEST